MPDDVSIHTRDLVVRYLTDHRYRSIAYSDTWITWSSDSYAGCVSRSKDQMWWLQADLLHSWAPTQTLAPFQYALSHDPSNSMLGRAFEEMFRTEANSQVRVPPKVGEGAKTSALNTRFKLILGDL